MNPQSWLHPHQQLLLRYAAQIRLDPRSWASTSQLIQTIYHAILNRAARPDEQALWTTLIQQSEIKWTSIVWQLLCSDEMQQLHPDWSLPRDPAQIQHALHRARCLLIRTELPAADTIVDLGGACTESISGALLWMGYAHPAREVIIIDLPPAKRMFADTFKHLAAETTNWIEVGQTRVRYIHTGMTDLSGVADASVDMLWLGQSIEHITQAQACQVYRDALRVLKPGGYFCLDTPNRALTRLQSPFGFIHPEHKHEYQPTELAQQLTRAGLVVKRTLGICPMPRSVRQQRFYPQEILDHVQVSPNVASSYFFYIESVKP